MYNVLISYRYNYLKGLFIDLHGGQRNRLQLRNTLYFKGSKIVSILVAAQVDFIVSRIGPKLSTSSCNGVIEQIRDTMTLNRIPEPETVPCKLAKYVSIIWVRLV